MTEKYLIKDPINKTVLVAPCDLLDYIRQLEKMGLSSEVDRVARKIPFPVEIPASLVNDIKRLLVNNGMHTMGLTAHCPIKSDPPPIPGGPITDPPPPVD